MRALAPSTSHTTTKLLLLACFLVAAFSFRATLVAAPAPRAYPAKPPAPSKKKKSKKTSHSKKHRGPTQKQPDADRTTEIQTALARGGYYTGDPSGKWDPDTVAALQKFQSANGLDSKGKLDAPTLQKLGLGSEIAGVSAPRPPVNPAPPAGSISSAPAPNGGAASTAPAPGTSSPPAAPTISTN